MLLLVLSACSSSSDATSTTTLPPTTLPPTTITAAPGPTEAEPELPPCLTGETPFVADGIVAATNRDRGDAATVAALHLDTYEAAGAIGSGCERFIVDLSTEAGAPATLAGQTRIEVLADPGIIRFTLPPAIRSTAVANTTFEGDFVDRAYVVETADGGLIIDVHLRNPALVRAFADSSPARFVLDARAGEQAPAGQPTVTNRAVVIDPVVSEAGYPLTVAGYVRTPAPEIPVTLHTGSDVIATTTVRGLDYPWRAFEVTFDDGPSGVVKVTVGDAEVGLVMP